MSRHLPARLSLRKLTPHGKMELIERVPHQYDHSTHTLVGAGPSAAMAGHAEK